MELVNPPFIKHYSRMIRKVYLHSLKVNPQETLFNHKRKSSNLIVEKLQIPPYPSDQLLGPEMEQTSCTSSYEEHDISLVHNQNLLLETYSTKTN